MRCIYTVQFVHARCVLPDSVHLATGRATTRTLPRFAFRSDY